MPKQPNVVYLLADQLRARSLPAYGEGQIATPNIDGLVREGIRSTNAVATCPLCAPYRSMLVTGRQPLETGHVINNVRARHDEISIADAFGHAGYRTGWVGTMQPATEYLNWFDGRRIVRNTFGPLGDPLHCCSPAVGSY